MKSKEERKLQENQRSSLDKLMSIPIGKTCGDCLTIPICRKLFKHDAKNQVCAFYPVRFLERPKEKPILFSGPMIRAILAGKKTQTRRIIGLSMENLKNTPALSLGDILYVRESWAAPSKFDFLPPRDIPLNYQIHYFADNKTQNTYQGKRRPSIHMPKSFARIWLKVKRVWVERLNDISELDARAEGCDLEWYGDHAGEENLWPCPACQGFQVHGAMGINGGMTETKCKSCDTSKKMFQHLWKSIYGPGSWVNNPFVLAIEFELVDK